MPITLRAFEDTDLASIAKLRAQSWQTESFWIDRVSRYLSGQHSPQKALAVRAIFVALEGEDVVGFVAGHHTTRFKCGGELQWIDVREDKRGHGISNELIEKMGEWFVEQNAFRVCVNVDPGNMPARKLYARCGAQPLNDHWMVWDDARTMRNLLR